MKGNYILDSKGASDYVRMAGARHELPDRSVDRVAGYDESSDSNVHSLCPNGVASIQEVDSIPKAKTAQIAKDTSGQEEQ
jgi:hypothetical protein